MIAASTSARAKKTQSVQTSGARSSTPSGPETTFETPEFLAEPLAIQRASGRQRAALVTQLQRRTGNANVSRVIDRLGRAGTDRFVQRLEACVEPPPAPTMTPETDPAFQQVVAKSRAVARNQKAHPPAKSEAGKAQAASVPPANDVKSKAAAAQVGQMNAQQPGSFNEQTFIDSVEKAVDAITPKSEDDASDFKGSGKAGQVASQVGGMVASNKQAAEKNIKQTTGAAPDPAKGGPPKKVVPLAPDAAKPRGALDAAEGMPKPRPDEEVSLAHTKCQTDNQLEDADVTEDQLKQSNEPQFTEAVDAKHEADAHAEQAPKQLRQEEKQALQATNVGANASAGAGTTGMQSAGLKALKAVGSRKESTKDKDEAQRAEIAQKLEAVYDRTKTDVTKILDDLGPRVETYFTVSELTARMTFENYVDSKMEAYKDERYSGIGGKFRHLGDYTGVTSLPDEVNVFYQTGRRNYMAAMRRIIGEIAAMVHRELDRAKARIAQGRKDVDAEVLKLPKNVRQLGKEAADNIQSRFDDLNSDVDSKQAELVQSIAKKYAEGVKAVDDKIAAMKEANKGLLQKARDAIKGVIETIGKLKDMLFGMLAKAASVIGQIIRHPIDFLGNLVGAIKQGFNQFVDNIGTHLKNGLMGWLFGTLAEGGIHMPESFDLKGILGLVLELLGLTYANIRSRVASIVGEKTIALLEKSVGVFQTLLAEGPAGLWKFIVDKLGEMKDAVMEEIQGFVITKIITAGVTWILSLLNPASAFIKACKMIYDVVMFFVERGSQIMSLVNAILDGVIDIAGGSIGGAANMVENALGKAIPVAISFLASLLGVGGIAEKVKSVIQKIKAPVNKLVDGVVMAAAKGFKKLGGDKLIGLAEKGLGWAKTKVKQGVAWVKNKATAAKDWAAGKVKGAKAWVSGKLGGKNAEKEKRLRQGVVAGVSAVNQLAGAEVGSEQIQPALAPIRSQFGLSVLEPKLSGEGEWSVHGEIQRMAAKTKKSNKGKKKKDDLEVLRDSRLAEAKEYARGTLAASDIEAPKVVLNSDAVGDNHRTLNRALEQALERKRLVMTSRLTRLPNAAAKASAMAAFADKEAAGRSALASAHQGINEDGRKPASKTSNEIYQHLVELARGVKDGLASKAMRLQVHHFPEVQQNPRTFFDEKLNRLKPKLDVLKGWKIDTASPQASDLMRDKLFTWVRDAMLFLTGRADSGPEGVEKPPGHNPQDLTEVGLFYVDQTTHLAGLHGEMKAKRVAADERLESFEKAHRDMNTH